MFAGIQDGWKKAEAAVVVEKLLENQKLGATFAGNPKSRANEIVSRCWDRAPHLLNGKKGPRPSKFSLAALSLADAIKYDQGANEEKLYLFSSLRELLTGVMGFPREAVISPLDEKLFELSANALDYFYDQADVNCLGPKV